LAGLARGLCRAALHVFEFEAATTVASVCLLCRGEDVIGLDRSLPECGHRPERPLQLVHKETRLVAGEEELVGDAVDLLAAETQVLRWMPVPGSLGCGGVYRGGPSIACNGCRGRGSLAERDCPGGKPMPTDTIVCPKCGFSGTHSLVGLKGEIKVDAAEFARKCTEREKDKIAPLSCRHFNAVLDAAKKRAIASSGNSGKTH
jgi:hypothetical protein